MQNIIDTDMQTKSIPTGSDVHLWLAVLDRAMRDLMSLERLRHDPNVLQDPIFIYDYHSLKRWFRSSSMELGSFCWICFLVEIEPEWALRKLGTKMQTELTPSKPIRHKKQLQFNNSRARAA
jgi:hypothetical protein